MAQEKHFQCLIIYTLLSSAASYTPFTIRLKTNAFRARSACKIVALVCDSLSQMMGILSKRVVKEEAVSVEKSSPFQRQMECGGWSHL